MPLHCIPHLAFELKKDAKATDMTDLIIHLGLTKTASTFIQRKILLGKTYTKNNAIKWDTDRQISKKFQAEFIADDWNAKDSYFGVEFFEKLMDDERQQNVIISNESLFPHNPFLDSPAILEKTHEQLSAKLNNLASNWRHGRVRVVYFYRQQAEWLPSMYANSMYLLKKPSQKHFEDQVWSMLRTNRGQLNCIDWRAMKLSLSEALGSSNVLALPYEDMHKFDTWKSFADFIEIDNIKTHKLLDDKTTNVKRLDSANEWVGSDRFQFLADISIFQIMRPIMRRVFNHKRRQQLLSVIGLGQAKITMPTDLRKEIEKFFS